MVARNRMVIGGTLGTPAVERWSIGLNFGPGSGPLISDPAELNDWANSMAALLLAMPTNEYPKNDLSTNGRIDRVDTYYYPGPGPASAAGSYTPTSPIQGAGAQANVFQVTRCITLRTALAGRSYRGRFFWPALGPTVGATGRAGISQAGVNSYRSMLQAAEGDGTDVDRLTLSVYSPRLEILTPVSTVAVGDVLDIQRRRVDALDEVYVSSPMT